MDLIFSNLCYPALIAKTWCSIVVPKDFNELLLCSLCESSVEDGDGHIHTLLEIFLSISVVLLFLRSVLAFPAGLTSSPQLWPLVCCLSLHIINTLHFSVWQDQVIFVHRNWADFPSHLDSMGTEKEEKSDSIQKLMSQVPQSLHGQFHGREIHSVHFVPAGNIPVTSGQHARKWIATGAEDGAVRISRLDSSELINTTAD